MDETQVRPLSEAVEPVSGPLHIVLHGPGLTPPITEYQSPDGDYIDTTRSWI
ncbi:hypothetical protein KIN20_030659 [Parelaphostrongylus tenuis]|uniref:Large ribosomal subunit protein mL40 n=1 Tax=Parelaphostrongylus tenuis TaxID=148309 RepID=A0AAD5WGK1_PARTN|nr:hypothetical protein KIN20_030659 [Parelaphostrongylus tenuis]